jgi:hypothetical protein
MECSRSVVDEFLELLPVRQPKNGTVFLHTCLKLSVGLQKIDESMGEVHAENDFFNRHLVSGSFNGGVLVSLIIVVIGVFVFCVFLFIIVIVLGIIFVVLNGSLGLIAFVNSRETRVS